MHVLLLLISFSQNKAYYKFVNQFGLIETTFIDFQNYLKQDAVVLAQFSDVMDTERLLKLLEEKKIRSVITIQDHENKGEQSLVSK